MSVSLATRKGHWGLALAVHAASFSCLCGRFEHTLFRGGQILSKILGGRGMGQFLRSESRRAVRRNKKKDRFACNDIEMVIWY